MRQSAQLKQRSAWAFYLLVAAPNLSRQGEKLLSLGHAAFSSTHREDIRSSTQDVRQIYTRIKEEVNDG